MRTGLRETATDVPVRLKACPECGRMLEPWGDDGHLRLAATAQLGVECGRCLKCGTRMTGREAR